MGRALQLNVLGPFETLWSDGEPAPFASKKGQVLLAFLATERARKPTREQLATLLWSRTGDERARHNLRQALAKIRALCDGLIVTQGESVSFNPGSCTVDVVEFDRLSRSEDPAELGRCLDLYRGDLLEGYAPREPACDEWLLLARARFRQMVCEVADRYVEALVVRGRVDEAIDGLNQRLAMDPACEPAHARLMQLFAGMGRRTDALRQYQACAAALQRDLGAEPGAETRSLYQALRDTERDVIAPYESRGTATASTGPDRPTVAVLPFDNLASAEDDYFVDGIVEDIITALSCFHSLLVIARGSSFHYRDGKVPDRQVAEELGAQFLVRGSVRRADDRVRIKVQLLDAVAGLNLWGHRYDRKIEDVFQLQDEITSTLVSTLAGKVEEARLAVARKAPPERLDAYDILLKGKDHHHRFSAKDCRACIDLFEQAIERDPSYALAHAWLACGLGQAMVFELDDPARLVDRSQAAAERGLVLDENDAESHRVLAQIFLTRRDLKRSIRHQERALFLNPNDDESVCSMGEILSFIGRHDEAEEWVRKSMRLNPYHPERYWTHLTRPLIHLGRYAEALDALEHIGRLRMDDHGYRVAASALLGDQQLLGQNLLELQTAFPEFEPDAFVASLPYDRENDRKELRDALLSGFEQKDAVSE